MAVSKKAEKERLKKERIEKLGNKLLGESLKNQNFKKEVASARKPRIADNVYYTPYKGKSDKEVAKDLISIKNRSLEDGNAKKRMENEPSRSFGKSDIPRSKLSKLGMILTLRGPMPDVPQSERPYYGKGKEGEDRFQRAKQKRADINRNYYVSGTKLKNEWEDPMYGVSEKDKQKIMKKKESGKLTRNGGKK